jgi:inosose dehydratase
MGEDNLLPKVHVRVSPLRWTNDVLTELGGDIRLETCLRDAAQIGYEELNWGGNFQRTAAKWDRGTGTTDLIVS